MNYTTTCKLTLWGFDVDAHVSFRKKVGDFGVEAIEITSVKAYGYEVDELTDKAWARIMDACEDEIFVKEKV